MAAEGFDPDPFQAEAFRALDAGTNVLVSAPTGTGKTLIGEYAADLALLAGRRCFYTTPVKALSNQKYRQFRRRFGADQVGLLTGDHSIDPDAPVVVMTTEVLRNMVYAGSSALRDLDCVVMDEIHYLGDRSRGVVWEEILLTLDPAVRLVGLSATLSNADELGEWISDVRGPTEVIRSEYRPVPLAHTVFLKGDLVPVRVAAAQERRVRGGGYHAERVESGRRTGWARRQDVLEKLDDDGLLPAIYFIFSRAGCDGAVQQMQRAGMRLTTKDESRRIAQVVDAATDGIPPADLEALGYADFRSAARNGLAAHHAGMVPVFRTIVEELFTAGLVKVVFATETLALGIHMPARAVVLEKTTKFDGDSHVPLTSAEYSQITGRAGRRGLDTMGTAVVLDQPELDLEVLSTLVDTPRFQLRSAFVPDYSMAVNLVERMGVDAATRLIGRSFAQFQTDRTLVTRGTALDERRRSAEQLRRKLDEQRGEIDLDSYAELRTRITALERKAEADLRSSRREAVVAAMLAQRAGAVVTVGRKRFGTVGVVLQARTDIPSQPSLLCLTDTGWTGWLRPGDFGAPPRQIGQLDVPDHRRRLSTGRRRAILARLERLRGKAAGGKGAKKDHGRQQRSDAQIAGLRKQLRAHPLHGAPETEKLMRLYERWRAAAGDVATLERELDGESASLEKRFRSIVALLTEAGYLGKTEGPDGRRLRATEAGQLLAGLHAEQDLLLAECLRSGAWRGLGTEDLAAVVTTAVAHPRAETRIREPADEVLRAALAETARLAGTLSERERRHHLPVTPNLDAGLAPAMRHWAAGGSLAEVLAASWQEGIDLTAGDFVRSARLVLDVLAQIGNHAEPAVARTARSAVGAMRRGVVLDSTT